MIYTLQRLSDNGKATVGMLYNAAKKGICFTLEDQFQTSKVSGETRIPAGLYELKFRRELTPLTEKYRSKYDWFVWHIEVTGISQFDNVYVHVGNYDTDTEGCILVGMNAHMSANYITDSVKAYEKVYRQMSKYLNDGKRLYMNIQDEGKIFS